MLIRAIHPRITELFFKGKAVIIHGARQVGKTTLIKTMHASFADNDSLYLNCDEPDIRARLTDVTSTQLQTLIGRRRIIFIDEAQRVRNIGLTLKLMVDSFPEKQVVVTGSSSIDLSNEMSEPLTGRKYEFQLFPFSLQELTAKYSPLDLHRLLEQWLIFGLYPEVVEKSAEARVLLSELASSYLFKDVLQYQDIRRPDLLERLLQALALQLGSEVSFNELAAHLHVSKETISQYIQLLEKAFVIFRLPPFSRNLRNELSKLRKIYFIDLGIRNALIKNFNPLYLRTDVGALWENFLIIERMKNNMNVGRYVSSYFWRTHQQQELDYLEEADGRLTAYEFKWRPGTWRTPKAFSAAYPQSSAALVHQENYFEFLQLND